MHRTTRWVAAFAVVVGAGLPLAACASVPSSTHKTVEPVKVETIGDAGLKRLTLEDKAVERLGIRTAPVTPDPTGQALLVMPYAALLYLPNGTTFAYTNPDGHTYVRADVAVQSIKGEQVVLTSGPAVGTEVVTTGGAELWGAEFGIK